MRLTSSVVRLVVESLRFASATRRISLALAILLGIGAALAVALVHLIAPLALYPFA